MESSLLRTRPYRRRVTRRASAACTPTCGARRGGPRPPARRPFPFASLLLLLPILLGPPRALAADHFPADAVKAAFLFRFAGFVEWPPDLERRTPFTIAVLDAPAVAAALIELAPGQTVRGRPLAVRQVSASREAVDAHVLYVGPAARQRPGEVAAALGTRPVLVVTEHPRGLDEGAAINFLLVERRVRFEVSLTAAQRVGLVLRAGLLSVAIRVEGASNRTLRGCGSPLWAEWTAPGCERAAPLLAGPAVPCRGDACASPPHAAPRGRET